MKFALIDEAKTHHTVSRLARALGVSRAGYHAFKARPLAQRHAEDQVLKGRIAGIHEASFKIYGAPRIHAELAAAQGIRIGKKRVARLMRELGIEGISRRGKRRVLKLAREMPAAPDLVHRNFKAQKPNALWLADITYIPTWEGWLFLAVIIDACTKRCCGWSMRDDLKAELVVDALGMAVSLRRPASGLIHHSDRGSQYGSLALGKTLRDSGVMASMGSRGDAYDNAAAESFMATIKTELIHRHRFKTKDEARLAVFRYIEGFYNPLRRHSALGHKSPVEYERMLGEKAAEAAVPS